MTANWYLIQLVHDERVKDAQREAEMRRLARTNREPSHWLNRALSRLQRSLASRRPRQRRQTNLPKPARGAPA